MHVPFLRIFPLVWVLLSISAFGCTSDEAAQDEGDTDEPSDDDDEPDCEEGMARCQGSVSQVCKNAEWMHHEDCALKGLVCLYGSCQSPADPPGSDGDTGDEEDEDIEGRCRRDEDCAGCAYCHAGLCRSECAQDSDCPDETVCNERCQCVWPFEDGDTDLPPDGDEDEAETSDGDLEPDSEPDGDDDPEEPETDVENTEPELTEPEKEVDDPWPLDGDLDLTESDEAEPEAEVDEEENATLPCSTVVVYERIFHGQTGDFTRVAWSPDGSYALILGYPGKVFLYRPGQETPAQTLEQLSNTGYYLNTVVFDDSGAALIGGGTAFTSPAPVLYRYTPDDGLVALSNLTGIGEGRLPSVSRIADISYNPETETFVLLSDNAGTSTRAAYLHLLNLSGEQPVWSYEGGLSISTQGAISIAWGTVDVGAATPQTVALGCTRYLELLYYAPWLSSGRFSEQSHTNTGNLSQVVFAPDQPIAWVLHGLTSSRVSKWDGVLRSGTGNDYGLPGDTKTRFSVSSDGVWKLFTGRAGAVTLSDAPWSTMHTTRFYNSPIPNFTATPWFGNSNTYLNDSAWRPGHCGGLIVGDQAGSTGLLVEFML